ncbi:MAG: cytochrome c biogenesis heme-transporting ATPase CcmA [Porticoccaceae bacterium]|nr:cytochrome c biogenesis heme-transporting ATPase CcmA [Porticoccaceae bacterium]
MSQSPLLNVDNLAFERDDDCLLNNVNLSLNAGEIVQVEGANGSGKTTLLRLLTTALQPSAGTIFYKGRALAECRYQYLSDMLYIGHQPAVKLTLTAEENLRWMVNTEAGVKHGSNADPYGIAAALAAVGLSGYTDVPCYALSAGQHRRVALARLMITTATLWYLDEPFTAIDKQGVSFLECRLQEHLDQGGAVVLTSHQDLTLKNLRNYSLSSQAGQVT